ncbi:MAG: hypothetical protein N3A55_03325 [Methylohalobius sp.]|nr:hypothetical protein [Methylohalobius sp.]
MLQRTRQRRILGAVLIFSGVLLMWLTPEIWTGVIVILIAIALEILGIALEHRS